MTLGLTGYLYVAVGGALGALARMVVGHWVKSFAGGAFPWHTFVINVSGSFLIGALAAALGVRASAHSAAINHFAAIGFLGAFTTFSTFELETWNLVTEGRWPVALAYVMGSVAVGFGGLALGIQTARLMQ